MEINNELRRTKEKLKILNETNNINWVLFDLIDKLVPFYPDVDKIEVIKTLKLSYSRYIEENQPKDLIQCEIFQNQEPSPEKK